MNEVKFRISLITDGKEKIVDAKTNVRQLAQAFSKAKDDANLLRNSLFLYSGVTQVFDSLNNSVQNVLGVFKDLIAANAEEVVAGAKLANNMRNTMAATDAEVQSIKELCAAQQRLGVIGDEVQLAGAQELATYLTKKQSLEQLIPVMNDMLAQQYGLTASSEQAAQIASMLGKVMDGQVGALSRYGYKFDEAQEQVLKFGTEEQRAAVLTDVVTSAVGGMNAALAQTDAGKAKQMANNMGDLKEKIGALLAPYEELIVKIGNWTMAINQTISVTSSVMGGLKTMRTFLLGIESAAYSCNMAFRAFVVEEKVLGMVSRATGVSLTTLKVAIRGVLIASVVGAAVVALTWALEKLVFSSDKAADGLDGVSDASQRLQQQVDAEKSAYSNARVEMDKEIQKLSELIKSKGNTAGAVQELNNKYGEAFGYHKTASEWYKTLTENSEAYCRQLGLEAKMKVLAAQGADIDFDIEKYKKQLLSLALKGELKEVKHTPTVEDEYGNTYGGASYEVYTDSAKSVMKKLGDAFEIQKQIEEKQNFFAQQMADNAKSIKTSPTAPTKPTGGDKNTGKEPLKLVEQPKSLEDLKNNVQYYEQAVSKADKADKEHLKTLVGKLDAAKQLVAAFEQNMEKLRLEGEGMSLKLRLEGWQEIDKELRAKGISLEGKEAQPIGVPVVLKPADVQRQMDWMPKAKPLDTTTPDYKRSRYDFLSQQAQRVQQDFEIGIIGENEALSKIEDINAALRGLGLNEIEIPLQTENVDKAKKKFEGATDAVGQMGQSLAGLGSALELPELNIAGTIAQAIATMALGYAKASATPKDPFTWLAFAATGLAQLTAMIASVKQATAFAQGGIVSGPTMALVGEYAGASNNPEVIAPLDKLRSMIGPQEGINGRVVFKIEGRTLRGVLEREHHHLARS